MYLYGASGHAKVIIDILIRKKIAIQGIYDDDLTKEIIIGFPILDVTAEIEGIDGQFIISIGDNKLRKAVTQKYMLQYSSVNHPSSIISESVSIGIGTVVMAQAVINSSTEIGMHVIVNTSASIDHDCIVKDYVHISPAACLCGGVSIETGAHIGAGAILIPGVKIGRWSIVGAGSVVIDDVPDYSVVVGNPARITKKLTR